VASSSEDCRRSAEESQAPEGEKEPITEAGANTSMSLPEPPIRPHVQIPWTFSCGDCSDYFHYVFGVLSMVIDQLRVTFPQIAFAEITNDPNNFEYRHSADGTHCFKGVALIFPKRK